MQPSLPPPPDTRWSDLDAPAELATLVEASVELRRAMARLDADRLISIYEAVEFTVRHAHAFVSSHVSRTGRRELARRAVIAELAVAWRVSERTMQRLASESYVLCTALPSTLAAMREGAIDSTHVRVIVEAVSPIDDAGVLASAEAKLAALARRSTPAKLRQAAKRLLERLQAETLAERHERAFAERAVQLEPAPDGMAWLAVQMRATDALLVRDRLQQAVAVAKVDPSESRTCAQLEADLARDLLLYAVPADDVRPSTSCSSAGFSSAGSTSGVFGSIRPTVHVTVPVLTLLGLDESPADLDGYGPIDAETARGLAANAPSFTRLLTHPVSGAVLDVDRDSYRVPADLRKWLQVRDGTCRFPGCTRRAMRCEVDHTEDWAADHGVTAHDNLAHLCAFHHHLKHETAWSLRQLEGGVLEWTSLTGAVYRTTPEGDLRAGSLEQAAEWARRARPWEDIDAEPEASHAGADAEREARGAGADAEPEASPAGAEAERAAPHAGADALPDPDEGSRPDPDEGSHPAPVTRRRAPAIYAEEVSF